MDLKRSDAFSAAALNEKRLDGDFVLVLAAVRLADAVVDAAAAAIGAALLDAFLDLSRKL